MSGWPLLLACMASGCVLASLLPEIWANFRLPARARNQSMLRGLLFCAGQLIWCMRGLVTGDWLFVGVTGLGFALGAILFVQARLARRGEVPP